MRFGAEIIAGDVGLRRLRARRARRALLAFLRVEQRIALQLVIEEGGKLQIGELQQLDRLKELRSHHQRLALPKIKARPKSHGRAA